MPGLLKLSGVYQQTTSSPDCILGDPNVRIGDMNTKCFQVAQAIVDVDAWRGHILLQLDHPEGGPGCISGRKVGP